MRRVFALGFIYLAYVACAGSQTQAEPVAVAEPPPAPTPAPMPSSAPEPAPAGAPSSSSAPPQVKAPQAAAKKSATDLDDSACPAGMQLIEGEYCSDVDYKCLK